MSWDVARSAIDFYLQRYIQLLTASGEKERILQDAPPNLGWYGGEPLLNFNLISKSHAYFLGKSWRESGVDTGKIYFTLNSNLSLLTDEILGFCVSNNIILYLSIDGPQEENDKFRITKGGKSSFDATHKSILLIKNKHPDYFKDKVVIFATACAAHDEKACLDFLGSLGGRVIRSEMIPPGRFLAEPRETIKGDAEINLDNPNRFIIRSSLSAAKTEAFDPDLFNLRTDFENPRFYDHISGMRTYPMGIDHLMISHDGTIQMCNKIDNSAPLGNVWSSYDAAQIVKWNRLFHTELNRSACRSCWAVRFCKVCVAPALRAGEFRLPDTSECSRIRQNVGMMLAEFINRQAGLEDRMNDKKASSNIVTIGRSE